MINFETKKVLFIDLDSTLIKTISGKTFPEDITDFRIQLPVLNKVIEKFKNLVHFFIVTNQGGIGQFVEKDDFQAKIVGIHRFCFEYLNKKPFVDTNFRYCDAPKNSDSPYRKPNTGMLSELLECYGIAYNKDNLDTMIMIGDASGKPGDFSDSDKKCAENFGIDYIDVRDFLKL